MVKNKTHSINKPPKGLFPLCRIFILFSLSMTLMGVWPQFALSKIQFKEVSNTAGINRWGDSFGASWGDFNGDSWPDLWVGNHCLKPALYQNNTDGSFIDVIDIVKNYDEFEQHGAAWADFDNDGDQDLIQIVGGGRQKGLYPNQFFINSGGLLKNVAVNHGLNYPFGRGRTPLWFDWNSDGYLDVFITNLNRTRGDVFSSALFTNRIDFFMNDTDITGIAGNSSLFAQLFLPAFMATPAIVVHRFRGLYPYGIYEYKHLPFRDITEMLNFPTTDSVSDVSIADFNNDLLNDFFLVTAIANSDNKVEDRLLIQTKDGFHDSTAAAGLNIPTRCVSVASADFDNDMDIDLYLVCTGHDYNTPNILYENLGDGTFKMVDSAGGAEGSSYGRGDTVITADYNNDGFVDIFVTNRRDSFDRENSHDQLFRNVGNSNHWIEFEIEGVISNRDGVGALLLASSNGITQMRVQDGGIHRFSQDHQRIHFGLSKNTQVERLTIQWPSGIVQKIENIRADQVMRVIELDFSASVTTGAPQLSVAFTSNSRGHYKPADYKWDFDNDGNIDSTDKHPFHTYKYPGIYTVKLTITDFDGNRYTSTRKNYIKVLSEK